MGQECGINMPAGPFIDENALQPHAPDPPENLMHSLVLDLIHGLSVVVGQELRGNLRGVAGDLVREPIQHSLEMNHKAAAATMRRTTEMKASATDILRATAIRDSSTMSWTATLTSSHGTTDVTNHLYGSLL